MDGIEQLTLRGAGVDLVADASGPSGSTAPLVFLHGSGQTRQSWGSALQQAAARGLRALALDLRGHGDSGWSPDGEYTLDHFAADIRAAIPQIGGSPVLVGASLGGLVGLLIAGSPPPSLSGLVLVDIAPRIEMDGARNVTNFMSSAPDGFGSIEEAADAVAAYLPHRQRPKRTDGLKRNLRLRNGRYYWHWDPAFIQMGRNAQSRSAEDQSNPFEQAARNLSIPTLLIRGGRSKVVSDESVREFRTLVPHGQFIDIAGADHMVAGDDNDAFNDAVFQFVEKLRPS
jgi:pimeloyl-ACP methyl ester carboxylesterase